jgi:hypothetical protein
MPDMLSQVQTEIITMKFALQQMLPTLKSINGD